MAYCFSDALMNETSQRFSKRQTISMDLDKVAEIVSDDLAPPLFSGDFILRNRPNLGIRHLRLVNKPGRRDSLPGIFVARFP